MCQPMTELHAMTTINLGGSQFEGVRRQAGIVDPEAAARLRVAVCGAGLGLPAVIYLLVRSGVGRAPGAILLKTPAGSVADAGLERSWLLRAAGVRPDDELCDGLRRLIESLDPAVRMVDVPDGAGVAHVSLVLGPGHGVKLGGNVIGVELGGVRVRVGPGVRGAAVGRRNVLSAGLANVGAALAVHQALVVGGAVRVVPFAEAWVSISLQAPGARGAVERGLVARVGDAAANCVSDAVNGAAVLRISLPVQDARVQDLLARTVIAPPAGAFEGMVPDVVEVDFGGMDDEALPEELFERRVVQGGAGGLGCWSAMILAESMRGGRIDLVDADDCIEVHNLNRQVLYRSHDIGRAKALAAEAALRRGIGGGVEVRGHVARIDGAISVVAPEAAAALEGCDLVLAGFDSFAARSGAAALACALGKTLVSGGAERLVGDAEAVLAGEGCLVCRWADAHGEEEARAMALQREVHACTREVGERSRMDAAPATTVALSGALQGLLACAALAGGQVAARAPRMLRFDLGVGTMTSACSERTAAAGHAEHHADALGRLADVRGAAEQLVRLSALVPGEPAAEG